jgi:hypothetical protein
MLYGCFGRYNQHAHRSTCRPGRHFLTERGIDMARLNANEERCEALFASALQRSDELTAEAVSEAIIQTARELGQSGCAGRMAQEFGDHPEAASERMRWARQLIGDLPGSPPAAPRTARAVRPAA